MQLIQIIETIFIITLFCCGLTVITGEGMLLHFLRKPFDDMQKEVNRIKNLVAAKEIPDDVVPYFLKQARWRKRILYSMKPFLLCCTCMASVWGAQIFLALHGLMLKEMILCCMCACFTNAYIIQLYNRL